MSAAYFGFVDANLKPLCVQTTSDVWPLVEFAASTIVCLYGCILTPTCFFLSIAMQGIWRVRRNPSRSQTEPSPRTGQNVCERDIHVRERAAFADGTEHIQYKTTVPPIRSTGYEPRVNSINSIHRISSTEFLLCLSICLYLQLHEQAHATDYFTPTHDAHHQHQELHDGDRSPPRAPNWSSSTIQ